MIRVLIVDDSAFMRKALSMMLEGAPEIDVIDTARDGIEALEKVKRLRPDVVTMDIEMPRMDGLTALRRIMHECPTKVIMVSSLTKEGAQATVEALQAGAVDFIPKQHSYVSLEITKIKQDLIDKVTTIARSRSRLFRRPPSALGAAASAARSVRPAGAHPPRPGSSPAGQPAGPVRRAAKLPPGAPGGVGMIVIGVSTGGPFALQQVIPLLPADLPVPVAVVQHMPPHFTRSLADRLNGMSPLTVVEAENGMPLEAGHVYLAPGGRHMTFKTRRDTATIQTPAEPASSLHRPSVDVMFRSASAAFGGRLLATVMTGMGKDGLLGVREIHRNGGRVIAQNEDTCVVYGMPRAIVEAGFAHAVLPLESIAPTLARAVQRAHPAAAFPNPDIPSPAARLRRP